MTTIVKENEIRQCVNISEDIIPIIENAFVSLSNGEAVMPPILRLDITENNGEVDVKTAYIKGLDSFAIKMSSGFYNNPSLGLPSTGGVMFLISTKTGKLETVLLDGGYLTDVRTAIAGAIAAKHLANENIADVGIIGAGMQAKLQLIALMLVRRPSTIRVWAREYKKAEEYIKEVSSTVNGNFINCKSPKDVTENSNLLITTTPSSSPLIQYEWLHKGLHITAMGSDAEHKNELDPRIIQNCDLYVADRQSQTSILGELHHAIKNNLVSKEKKFIELGDVISKKMKGRSSQDQITVCDLTGTGVQDTAIARYALEIAIKNKLGLQLD